MEKKEKIKWNVNTKNQPQYQYQLPLSTICLIIRGEVLVRAKNAIPAFVAEAAACFLNVYSSDLFALARKRYTCYVSSASVPSLELVRGIQQKDEFCLHPGIGVAK